MSYNPKPTRVWSRVQHPCTFTLDVSYNSVFSPLTGKTTSLLEADYYNKLIYKGNILQYKKNTSNLTKSQRYSQICKGMWTNRTKSYATQTQTYTNPNTSNLKQVNFINVPTNGNTTYIPGPYNFNIPAPNGCISDSIKDGGSLLCNTIVNPCTNEVIEVTKVLECYPTSCSDVPGPIIDLCWNSKLDTWYPRQNLTMNNSADKWPEGYKEFVSAVKPDSGFLSLVPVINTDTATLSWTFINNDCIPISSYNIYENGQLIANVPYPTTSYNVLLNCGINDFYVTSVSLTIESEPSNIVSYKINNQVTTTGNISYIGDYTYVTFLTSGTISFTCDTNIQFTLVGGGASGGSYSIYEGGTSAGGGGQILNTSEDIMVTSGNVLSINVGNGGIVPPIDSIGYLGDNTSITGLFSLPVSTDNSLYGGGGGQQEVDYSYKGGGGNGNNTTSRQGGFYFVNSSSIGFGAAGAAGSLTNINALGVISVVTLPSPGGNASNGTAGTGSNGFQGINGTYYGGGGGGGLIYNTSYSGGLGGLGGGGSGANASGISQSPVSGTVNTGGGGGGGFYLPPPATPISPAAGGSGIAIIRFLT
jgi:hypothetical protein